MVSAANARVITARIISHEEPRSGLHLIRVESPLIAGSAMPGQYIMVRCGQGPEMPLRRPLSIHRVLSNNVVVILFVVAGRGTSWLAERSEGDMLDIFGPLGRGFDIYPQSRRLLLVAGGIGIAPLAFLADYALTAGLHVTLVMGDRTSDRILPGSLLPPGIEPVVVTEDGSLGRKGMATDLIPLLASEADQVFACGPLPMYCSMSGMLSKTGNKPIQVSLETVLGCGAGACLGCSIETVNGRKLVCRDGPVFELGDIAWEMMAAPPCTGRF